MLKALKWELETSLGYMGGENKYFQNNNSKTDGSYSGELACILYLEESSRALHARSKEIPNIELNKNEKF